MKRVKVSAFMAATLVLLVGCQHSPKRTIVLGAGSAAGGGLGYALSDGNPWATVGGAAGGAVLTHLALGEDKEAVQWGFAQGYTQGCSDAIKRQYWLLQSLNRSTHEGQLGYYSVPVKEVSPDGRQLVEHTVTVPIVE